MGYRDPNDPDVSVAQTLTAGAAVNVKVQKYVGLNLNLTWADQLKGEAEATAEVLSTGCRRCLAPLGLEQNCFRGNLASGSALKDRPSVRSAESSISTRWDAFVEDTEPGNLCHCYAWKPVFESTYGLRCEYLLAERDGAIVGILPLVVIAGLFAGKRLVSLPFLDRAA